MGRRFYYTLLFGALLMIAGGCVRTDFDMSRLENGQGNIVLKISANNMPVTRATLEPTEAEMAISCLDVWVFEAEGGKRVHYERVDNALTSPNGTITLSESKEYFTKTGQDYSLYLVANSTADAGYLEENYTTLDSFKTLDQTDIDVHLTALTGTSGTILEDVPKYFLMDGTIGPVQLNDGNNSTDTKLTVDLKRAAAKMVVNIHPGSNVSFASSETSGEARYYIKNLPVKTAVLAGANREKEWPELITPTGEVQNKYFVWPANNATEDAKAIAITAYSYYNDWNDASLDKQVRLVVNIPMTINGTTYNQNWYQIPVSREKVLNRNHLYNIGVTVNVRGADHPSKPVLLTNVSFAVKDWVSEDLSVGISSNKPVYLTLNEDELVMANITEDKTSIKFSSSSPVTVRVKNYYFIDADDDYIYRYLRNSDGSTQRDDDGTPKIDPKNTEQFVYDILKDNSNEILQRVTSNVEVSVTNSKDGNHNGNILIDSEIPYNNAIRYIEVEVINEKDGITREFTVKQYPLEYITHELGWYSYRSDFGGTCWEYAAGKKLADNLIPFQANTTRRINNVTQAEYNAANLYFQARPQYSNNDTTVTWAYTEERRRSYFRSRVAVPSTNNGITTYNLYHYGWSKDTDGDYNITYYYQRSNQGASEGSLSNYNPRLYTIHISSSSPKYRLGVPRLDNGYTEASDENAELVAPAFMIASQLGVVWSGYFSLNLTAARDHCDKYVETYVDQNTGKVIHLDDWRLPTKGEIEAIMDFQPWTARGAEYGEEVETDANGNTIPAGTEFPGSPAMVTVLTGAEYWCANGYVTRASLKVTKTDLTTRYNIPIRCVRTALTTPEHSEADLPVTD